MQSEKIILAILIVLILVFTYIQCTKYKQVFIGSRRWNVIRSYSNCDEAARLLANANGKMIQFLRHLKKKYHIDLTDEEIALEGRDHIAVLATPNDVRNMAGVLVTNYNPDEFYETDPRYTNDTSYTVDKGESMHLCLRDKKNPDKLIDLNTIIFVMLHESAHIANYKYWGHTQYFWSIFRWLLHEATSINIYQPIDYSKYPVDFCGLHVGYSPLFDSTLPNIWEH